MSTLTFPGERRNVDNDPLYRRPKAWAKAKDAFGPCKLTIQMRRLELIGGCPRFMLEVAISRLLSLDSEGLTEAVTSHFDREKEIRESYARAESVPPDEMERLLPDLDDAARKIGEQHDD